MPSAMSTTGVGWLVEEAWEWGVGVKVRTVFAFRVDFDKDFLSTHDFDDFADVAAGLLEQTEFFA